MDLALKKRLIKAKREKERKRRKKENTKREQVLITKVTEDTESIARIWACCYYFG